MSKTTKKQLKAQIINDIARQYNHQNMHWKGLYQELSGKYDELRKKYNEALDRANKAESKLSEYEDWIQRLQDFCNLSDEDRKNAIEKMRLDYKHSQAMESIDKYTRFLFGSF